MARRVFFSFHYQRDSWRVNQVRNSWVTKYDQNSFLDAASWEKVERQGDSAIKRWIDSQLYGTSVTVVLIGAETADRRYVKYEIQKSFERGNGLLGINIHNVKDKNGSVELWSGPNPFDNFSLQPTNEWEKMFPRKLSEIVSIYDWVHHGGYTNISSWIEAAAQSAGR